MPGRFMDNIGCRSIFNVVDLADISGDNQYAVGLIFHKSRRRNKAINSYRSPADLCQSHVHIFEVGNSLNS